MGNILMLHCDMKANCMLLVTHIDHKGYIYCDNHAQQRMASGVPVRKLTFVERQQIADGKPISWEQK